MIVDSSFNLAVHALVCLSHSGRSLSSEALAENICTNPTRVRRVLAGLKKAGMVETREGLDGGYPGNAGRHGNYGSAALVQYCLPIRWQRCQKASGYRRLPLRRLSSGISWPRCLAVKGAGCCAKASRYVICRSA